MFGEQQDYIFFDPRGVNNSGLGFDCFSGNIEARRAFNRLHNTGITNTSTAALEEQYYSSSIFGEWCNIAVENKSPHGFYVTTPAVAHDLLTFIEAEAEEAGQSPSDVKLWCYGASHGTSTGTTVAFMFPDRVGRMVLDGVMNTDEYYSNYWTVNLDQMDQFMEKFSSFCHSAGAEACSFWGPTPANITARLEAIIRELQSHPVLIIGAQTSELPTLVTIADLKTLFINTAYFPLKASPGMADILHQIELGDWSGLAGLYDATTTAGTASDARFIIQCADSYRTNKLSNIEEYKDWVEYLASLSKIPRRSLREHSGKYTFFA